MKIFLTVVFLIIGLGECSPLVLKELNKDDITQLHDNYIAAVFENNDKSAPLSSQLNFLELMKKLWDDVASGDKKILLATEKDMKYVGHIFFSRKKDGSICLESPGYSSRHNIPRLFKAFIRYARKIGHKRNNLVFDLPSERYKALMKGFGLVENECIDQQLQRFILTVSTKLKKLNKKNIAVSYYQKD